MTERDPLPPELRALIEHERLFPAVPAAQRARALARARAALATREAAMIVPTHAHSGRRWLAAAAAALLASAAVGAAAYEIRAHLTPRHAAPAARPTPVVAIAPAAPPPAVAVEEKVETQASAPEPAAAAGPSRAQATRAELRLLRAARAAVARRDFAGALAPIGEHARKFKNGRLAEEREALRVKALSGLGRTEEARRAAAAFRARFPRSVLLPAVSRMPASEP